MVRVMIVPVATVEPAVTVHVAPAPLVVLQDMIALPAVQVAEDVLGVTEVNCQVKAEPV